MKKVLVLTVCLFCFFSVVSASDLKIEESIPENTLKQLRKDGKIILYDYEENTESLKMAPKVESSEIAKSIWKSEKKPLIKIELLMAINKKGYADEIAKIQKQLQAFSTMQGIQYYSHTKRKRTTLYKQCYVVDGVNTKNRLPDTNYNDVNGKEVFVFQEDSSFGKYTSCAKYFKYENQIGFTFENEEPIGVLFFKGAEPKEMQSVFSLIEFEDEIIVYAVIQSVFPKYPGMEKNMKNSLVARIEALSEWIVNGYNND